MRLWGGRFSEENDPRMADFTRSIDVDARAGRSTTSPARSPTSAGSAGPGLLTDDEVAALVAGLAGLRRTSRRARSPGIRRSRTCTSTSRRRSPTRVGPVAGKLHTGRSRNDQVATDLRLWLRRDGRRARRRRSSASSGRSSGWPSATATRCCPARRTSSRPSRCCSPTTCSPTSRCSSATAAGSPTRAPAERLAARVPGPSPARASRSTARRRPRSSGFDGVTANSLDAVVRPRLRRRDRWPRPRSAMVHLSRLAEEITWWSNPRFGFVRVADAFSTGSSMMPNKRNPDPAELVRGRTAAVIGALTGMLDAAQGPAARLPARPPGGQAAAVRGGRRRCEASLRRHGRARRHPRRGRRADARRGRGGLHDGDGGGRRAGPAGRAVPGGAPHRRRAGRRRGGRRRTRRGDRRDDRAGARLRRGQVDRRSRGGPGIGDELRGAASLDGALPRPADVIGGTAPAWQPHLPRPANASGTKPDVPTLDTIRRAPKVLLHDRLDGRLRPRTVIELAEETGYTGLPTERG